MALLPDWLGLDAVTRSQLPELLATLVDEPSVISAVIEDLALPPGARVVSWAVGMCLRPALVAELGLNAAPAPFIARSVYRALLDRRYEPMTERELGLANAAADIRLAVLHFEMKVNDFGDPLMQSLMIVGTESFRSCCAGYNTQAIYQENRALKEPYMLATGFQRRPHAGTPLAAQPGECPQYYRVTRTEAIATAPGNTVRHIFEHHPPLFRLSPSQRRLLWLSLFDASDDALVQRLGVSMHGLKKLWRGIYERIQDQQPGFFGDTSGDEDGKRGPEKRRQVLAYVRQRPEELRPWVAVAEP